MEEFDINGNPLPKVDATHVIAAPAGGASSVENVPAGLTLAELNQHLGKNFPTKETALKALSDTFSYVGKKKEDIEREVRAGLATETQTNELAAEISKMRTDMFYKDNPQFAEANVRKFIESTGKSPTEVVNTPEFKAIFEKVAGYDESQKLRTVLETNPRLTSSRDALTKARELQTQNPMAVGRQAEEIEQLGVNAVKDAFGLK